MRTIFAKGRRTLFVCCALLLFIFVVVSNIINEFPRPVLPENTRTRSRTRRMNTNRTFEEIFISVAELKEKYITPPPNVTVQLALVAPWIKDHSQLDQPFWIQEILGELHNGFYIESGAFDGEGLSNTLMLERYYNWSGLLVEADPHNFGILKAKNRHAYTSNTCLSVVKHPISVTFIQENVMGRIATNGLGEELERRTVVRCFPLYMYLQALNQTTVDYFSLDVEGSELDILKTIPWKSLNIRTLSVEHSHGVEKKEAMRTYMESNGYYVFGEIPYGQSSGSDYLFVKISD